MKTDLKLRQDVENELLFEPCVHPAEIGVTAENGVVTLTGYVDNYAEKWAAERAAKRVAGVKAISEEIQVRLPGLSERTDTDIARAATNALEWNVWVPRDRIKAVVADGWITLDGNVEWQYQKTAAEDAVRHLMGVKGVINNVKIEPKVTPIEVRTKITDSFKRNAQLDAKGIKIEISGDKVTLTGQVHSWAERDAAQWAAWSVQGVGKVENDLIIEA